MEQKSSGVREGPPEDVLSDKQTISLLILAMGNVLSRAEVTTHMNA